MASSGKSDRTDKVLGMDQKICRRDFLNSTLLASGGLLLGSLSPRQLLAEGDWTGYGGVGDYSDSNGNTFPVMTAGHQIRNGVFDTLPSDIIDTGETFDCVMVGGGISGIAGSLFFRKYAGPKHTSLVLEDHPIFGGEAKRNEFIVDGHRIMGPQGSDHFQYPFPYSFIGRFYEMIGLDWNEFDNYQTWKGPSPELPLGTSFEDAQPPLGMYFGAKFGKKPGVWLIDPWKKKLKGAPIPATMRAQLIKYSERQRHGLPFEYPGDEKSRQLDSITIKQHLMEDYGLSNDTIETFMAYAGGGFGAGPDVLSAYCMYAFETLRAMSKGTYAFPGGNCGVARQMVKTLIPDSIAGPRTLAAVCRNKVNFSALDRPGQNARIRLGSTVVWVKHDGDPASSKTVTVVYTRGGKVYRLKARSVVMAGGCWTSKLIVRDLPTFQRQAYDQFYRSPCLMTNVAVRNWRFLYKMGISGCQWFEGLGSFTSVRKVPLFSTDQKTIGPDSPVVLTLKAIFPHPGMSLQDQGNMGRAELLSTSFRDYERQIRKQLTEMFSRSGFNARRDIAGIVLNRWGHAYVSPQPGFFFGKDGKPAPREALRAEPFGRIAFANTDLSGKPDHRTSIMEAHRAVNQLLNSVITT